jgi:hypothetical protein
MSDAVIGDVGVRTIECTPRGATHWSSHEMARATGLSAMTISRIWRAFGVQPHRSETFQDSPLVPVCPNRAVWANSIWQFGTPRRRVDRIDLRAHCTGKPEQQRRRYAQVWHEYLPSLLEPAFWGRAAPIKRGWFKGCRREIT